MCNVNLTHSYAVEIQCEPLNWLNGSILYNKNRFVTKLNYVCNTTHVHFDELWCSFEQHCHSHL